MKDTRVHLNTNGNIPVGGDQSAMQEIMRMIAGVRAIGRRRYGIQSSGGQHRGRDTFQSMRKDSKQCKSRSTWLW